MADADADPVATDQAPALVGDDVRHLGRVERRMDLPAEGFQLRPGLFLTGGFRVAGVAQIAGGIPGHLDRVSDQILRMPVRLLEDLDDAEGLVVLVEDRRQRQGEVSRVAGLFVAIGALSGTDQSRLALREGEPEQLLVRLTAIGPVVQANVSQVGLALLLQEPLGGLDPHRAGGGVDAVEALAQEFLVELARRHVRAGERRQLFDRQFHLSANSTNGVFIERVLSTDRHRRLVSLISGDGKVGQLIGVYRMRQVAATG